MNCATSIERLHRLEPILRSAGLTALYLFGSAARGDARSGSDIDRLFEADGATGLSLIDQARLQQELSKALGAPVDLIERAALRPAVRRRAEIDMTRVF